jgi:hypothetical protein
MITRAGYLTTRFGGYLHREVPEEDAELSHVGPDTGPDKTVIHREKRLPVGRTHIGKDDAAVFMGGIGPVVCPTARTVSNRAIAAWSVKPCWVVTTA